MNFPYKFQWRRRWLSKSRAVIGHSYNHEQNKMVLYYDNGAIQEIKNWSQCECFLDVDWVLAQKKRMEAQTGQSIPLAVNTDKK